MAIVNRCCCLNNVRSGSALSAFYTLISCVVFLGFAAAQLNSYIVFDIEADLMFIASSLYVALLSLIILCAVLVLWGTAKDNRWFLLPYMITMPVFILLQLATVIMVVYLIIALGGFVFYSGSAYIYIFLGVQTVLMSLNISCFLTVTSQYQELRDGRGTSYDVGRSSMSANRQPFGGLLAQQGQAIPMQGQPPEPGKESPRFTHVEMCPLRLCQKQPSRQGPEYTKHDNLGVL